MKTFTIKYQTYDGAFKVESVTANNSLIAIRSLSDCKLIYWIHDKEIKPPVKKGRPEKVPVVNPVSKFKRTKKVGAVYTKETAAEFLKGIIKHKRKRLKAKAA